GLRWMRADPRDAPRPLRSDVGQIDAGCQSAKGMIRADIRGRLGPPYVLLARRQCEHESAATSRVGGRAHQPARQPAHQGAAAGDEADVRATEAGWQPKLLALTDGDVGPVLSRSTDQP